MSDLLAFNGIDAATGTYLVPPMAPADLSALARGAPVDKDATDELKRWWARISQPTLGTVEGIDATDLAQTGWGVVFAQGADPAVRQALAPLLEHRKAQAGSAKSHYYREFVDDQAYRPGETKRDFLKRHGAGTGPADPEKVPYYLLLVGDPETIPYSVQYQLDVQYAVGRIHFDSVEDYAAYARSVVAAENATTTRPKTVTFFAAKNTDDRATALSSAQLIAPLAQDLATKAPEGWAVSPVIGDGAATKARLAAALGGPETPGLLFTATHGIGLGESDPNLLRQQGALLCQDWAGPVEHRGPLTPDLFFAADDVAPDADLSGLIAFHFACFGAGTPRFDDFAHGDGTPRQIAPQAFVAALPKRLLCHPGGGALAVIGHVERAWGYSFSQTGTGQQTGVYLSCLTKLLKGFPIGTAFDYFNERYAELSSDLTTVLDEITKGTPFDDVELGTMWTENNDARGFAIIGDPAVRLPGAGITPGT